MTWSLTVRGKLTWRVNPTRFVKAGQRRSVARVRRVGARGQSGRRRVWARAGMQDVGSLPGFQQWIRPVVLYTMICSKTHLENFYFWVWIKHPLCQEQALIPVVGFIPEFKHTQFTWFGNLPTPRSYWFILIKLRNNTNKGGGDKTLSTQLYSLKLSLFFYVLSSLCVSLAAATLFFSSQLYMHTHSSYKYTIKGA